MPLPTLRWPRCTLNTAQEADVAPTPSPQPKPAPVVEVRPEPESALFDGHIHGFSGQGHEIDYCDLEIFMAFIISYTTPTVGFGCRSG